MAKDDLGKRIFDLMERRGIKQIDFCRMTGISQSTVSDWKRKGNVPQADKIKIICDVLNITPNDLYEGFESRKYKSEVDYIIVDKSTQTYRFIEKFEALGNRGKERVLGYMDAILDMNKAIK